MKTKTETSRIPIKKTELHHNSFIHFLQTFIFYSQLLFTETESCLARQLDSSAVCTGYPKHYMQHCTLIEAPTAQASDTMICQSEGGIPCSAWYLTTKV